MTSTPPSTAGALPDDPAALKAMIATLARRVDDLELAKLRLTMELLRYKKWMYGPRADTLTSLGGVHQMLLGFGEDLESRPVAPAEPGEIGEIGENDANDDAAPRRIRAGRGRRDLERFEHLPLTRHEYDLAEADKPCPCCGTMRVRIGADTTWQIEYIPGRFERLEHVRFKYACAHCEQSASPAGPQIVRAYTPGAPIERGLAGPGLLAYVVTSKYADYLPLYRLEDIFRRGGFEIARSTMSLWCRDVADIAEPLYRLMAERVRRSRVIGTDDTIMPMLCPGAGKTKKARMWVYVGGVGGVGDEGQPYTIFDFTLSRARDGPSEFLKGYTGTLLADAYGGYDGIVVGNQLARAGCWAHARRKFVEAEATHPAIAAEAVGMIKTLYAIKDRGRALDAEARAALRCAESAPILAALRDRLLAWREELLPKHPMAQAIGYALNQWDTLTVFAGTHPDGGRVPIDNNISEREMKRIVLNRKNSLFVGNSAPGAPRPSSRASPAPAAGTPSTRSATSRSCWSTSRAPPSAGSATGCPMRGSAATRPRQGEGCGSLSAHGALQSPTIARPVGAGDASAQRTWGTGQPGLLD